MSNTNFKGGYRDGSISLEEAKKVFNDYYDKRAKSKIGQFRAKLFDMMYQKKEKFTLTPDQKGSIKYKLQEGPRTFDMKGVDWFPEGTTFQVEKDGKEYTSKGATNRKDNDTNNEIYGPRIKDDSTLYSEHFADKYEERVISNEFGNDDEGNTKNLVDIYWQKYRDDPSKYMRKNKKDRQDIITIDFASYNEMSTRYRISSTNPEILYNLENEETVQINNEELEESTLYFLYKLKFLDRDSDGNYHMVRKRASIKYIRVFTDSRFAYDAEDGIEFNLETGYIINQDCNDTVNTFYEFFGAEHDLDDIVRVEAVECNNLDKEPIKRTAQLNIGDVGFEFGNPLTDRSDASSLQSSPEIDSPESLARRTIDERSESQASQSPSTVSIESPDSKDESQSLSDIVVPAAAAEVDLSDINIKSRASALSSISEKSQESDGTPETPQSRTLSDESQESDGTPQSRDLSELESQGIASDESISSKTSSQKSEITVDTTDSQQDEQRDKGLDVLAMWSDDEEEDEEEEDEEEEEDSSLLKDKELDLIYQSLPDDVRSIDGLRTEMENLDL